MDFVTLNKQKSAIKSPSKNCQFFVAPSLKFGKVGQNFVKAKHTGRTRQMTMIFIERTNNLEYLGVIKETMLYNIQLFKKTCNFCFYFMRCIVFIICKAS